MATKMQKERRERARDRAAALRRAADGLAEEAVDSLEHIPPGQPILIGHHSERHHRRDLARHDRKMRKAVELSRQADAAAGSQAGRAVLGHDPEALDELRRQLAAEEAAREKAKDANRAFRRGGWDAVADVLGDERAARIRANLPHFETQPFPSYALRNAGARIRRLRGRIEEIEQRLERGDRDVDFDGGSYEEDADANRLRLRFDARLSKEHYQAVRGLGFRWSRQEGAFQRHLNNAGRYAAQQAVRLVLGVDLTFEDA